MNFTTSLTDLNRTVSCTISGLNNSINKLNLFEAIVDLDVLEEDITEEEATKRTECANDETEWSVSIIKSDYQVIYSYAIILLWSKLESTILDFAHQEILRNKNIIKSYKFDKISIPISTYQKMSGFERAHFIIDSICEQCKYQSKPGVERFESIVTYLD